MPRRILSVFLSVALAVALEVPISAIAYAGEAFAEATDSAAVQSDEGGDSVASVTASSDEAGAVAAKAEPAGDISVVASDDESTDEEESDASDTADEAVATVTTSDGAVTSYTDLQSALTAATDGSTVTLLSDLSITPSSDNAYLLITTDITLDLGGNTLTFTSAYSTTEMYLYNADVTITNGTISDESCASTDYTGEMETIFVYCGDLTLDDVTIQAYAPLYKDEDSSAYFNYGVYIYNGNETVTMTNSSIVEIEDDEDSTVTRSGLLCGVVVNGYYYTSQYQTSYLTDSSKYIATIDMDDSMIDVSGYGIVGTGSWHNTDITVTDSTIYSTAATCIYHPQYGSLTIEEDDGTTSLNGLCGGIEMRAGVLTITGGTISCSGTPGDSSSGAGTTVYGAAIAISQHSTDFPITVTISGGTFEAYYALYEEDTANETTEGISITISGGTFTSTGDDEGAAAVKICDTAEDDEVTVSVSGGTFSTEIDSSYVASDYVAATTASTTVDEDGTETTTYTYTVISGSSSSSNDSVVSLADGSGETIAYYSSLSSALSAAGSNGYTLTLLSDITESVTVSSTVTLDLAGCTLSNTSGSHTITVADGGDLTVIDSSADDEEEDADASTTDSTDDETVDGAATGTGVVDCTTTKKAALYVEEGGTATLSGGTFKRSAETGTSTNTYYTILNQGTLTIEDGTTVELLVYTTDDDGNTTTTTATYSSIIDNGWPSGSPTTDGDVATLYITGGYINGGKYLKNDSYGVMYISGGTIANASANGAILNWNELEISGGTITNSRYAIFNCSSSADYECGSTTITGGTFTYGTSLLTAGSTSSDLTVSGGSFSTVVDSAYCADGYVPVTEADENGYYTVDTSVATVSSTTTDEDGDEVTTTTRYEVLQDALTAAANDKGDDVTVTLLQDVEVANSYLLVAGSMTIDLNECEITFSTTKSYYNAAIYISGDEVEITNGTITDKRCYGYTMYGLKTVWMYGGSLTTSDLTIQTYAPNSTSGYNYILYAMNNSGSTSYPDVTLEDGTEILDLGNSHAASGYSTNGCVGVTIIGAYATSDLDKDVDGYGIDEDKTLSLTVEEGAEIETYGFAISGNGAYHGTDISIEGGTITSTGSTGIYHPQYGTLTISGGTITGATTGVEMRAGILVMSAGSVTGEGAPTEIDANGNGTTSDGAGIAVSQHTTNLVLSVTITGGSVTGYTALYEADTTGDGDTSGVTLCVTGGTFTSTDKSAAASAIYSADCTGFVSGVTTTDEDGETTTTAPVASTAIDSLYCDEGWVPTDEVTDEDGNSYYTVTASDTVVYVYSVVTEEDEDGEESSTTTLLAKYGSLQDALDAAEALADDAEEGTTYTVALGSDITESVTVSSTVTLDLAGYTLSNTSGSHTITVAGGGDLTVIDSSADDEEEDADASTTDSTDDETVDGAATGTGVVDCTTTKKAALYVEEGGTATLSGGTFKRSAETGTSTNTYYTILNQGTLTIEDGTTVELLVYTTDDDGNTTTATATYSSIIDNGWPSGSPSTDGDVATLYITGGYINGGKYLKNDSYGVMYISGGTIANASANGAILNWNELTISGGTITNSRYAIFNCSSSADYECGSTTITGGTFTYGTSLLTSGSTSSDLTVSGGSFSTVVDSAYCAEGYVPVTEADEDGYYTVDTSVATVSSTTTDEDGDEVTTTTRYEVLQDALTAAASDKGDDVTVTLLQDVEVANSYLMVSGSMTIDLGGNEITFTTSTSYYNAAIYISGEEVEITNGTITDKRCYGYTMYGLRTVWMYGGSLETSDLTIQTYAPNSTSGYNYILYAMNNSGSTCYPDVTLGDGTKILDLGNSHASYGYSTNGCVGVTVIGAYATSALDTSVEGYGIEEDKTLSLTVEDGATITTGGFAISGNGAYHGTDITIEGGTITSTGSTGIYHPQYGTLTISGGTITGATTGVEMRAGILVMSGGSVTGKGAPTEIDANGNGTTSDGAGIAVSQHTTNLVLSVTITGGSVTGYTALYEADTTGDGDTSGVTLSVTGGTFTSTDETSAAAAIYSADCTGFVSGTTTTDEDGVTTTTAPIASTAIDSLYCAEGWVPTGKLTDEDGNTYYTVVASDTVVYVYSVVTEEDEDGEESSTTTLLAKYGSLQDALDAAEALADDAEEGTTYTVALGSDITESVTVSSTVTLDLAGYTLSGDTTHTINVKSGGNLTIEDSSEEATGEVLNKGIAQAAALAVYPGGECTVNGGYFYGDKWYVVKNLGTLTINDCTLVQGDTSSSGIDNGWYGSTSNDLGLSSSSYSDPTATLTINGGSFSNGVNAVKNDDYGVLTITGGTFSNTSGAAVLNWNVATISGGTFSVSNADYGVIANGYLSEEADAGTLTITGGTFIAAAEDGCVFGYAVGTSDGGSVTVTGGTFEGDLSNVVESGDSWPYDLTIGAAEDGSTPTFSVAVDQSLCAEGFLGTVELTDEDGNTYYTIATFSAELGTTSYTYTTEAVELEGLVVTFAGNAADEYDLVYYDEDGEELESAPSDAGSYTVVVTSNDDSPFTGSSDALAFTIGAVELTEDMLGDYTSSFTYTGSTQVPTLKLTNGDETLQEGTDYVLTYSASSIVEAGNYTVYITGTGNYTGTLEVNFTIAECTHEKYDSVVTEATCTEQGYTTHTCTTCGYSYVDTYTNALGHDYSVAWTWSEDYSMAIATATCKNDSSHVVIEVALASNTSGNTIASTTTTAATCTETGVMTYTATVTIDDSTVTGTKTATIEATGHSYEAVVTDPTCTEQGYTTYTCSVCGDSYVDDYTDATGHSYDYENLTWSWSSDYSTATVSYSCTVCGDTQTESATITSETNATGITYTATATVNGETVTNTQTVSVAYVAMVTTDDGESYTYYTSLSDAIKAARGTSGETTTTVGVVTLLADCTLSTSSGAGLNIYGDLTIDLNGYTLTDGITANWTLFPQSGASITITDTSEDGGGTLVESSSASYGLIYTSASCSIEISNVSVTGTKSGVALIGVANTSTSNTVEITLKDADISIAGYVVLQYTTYNSKSCYVTLDLTVDGGSYTSTSSHAFAFNGTLSSNSTMDFDDATVTSYYWCVNTNKATATFDNCTFTVTGSGTSYAYEYTAVAVDNGGSATINSGTYTAPYAAYVYSSGGTLTINGGTLTGSTAAAQADNDTYDNGTSDEGSYIYVTGGTLVGDIVIGSEAVLEVSGGWFDEVVALEDCAEGYVPVTEPDATTGKYTVAKGWAVTVDYGYDADEDDANETEIVFVYADDPYLTLDDPERDGYVFAGWEIDDETVDMTDYEVSSTFTVKATWHAHEYDYDELTWTWAGDCSSASVSYSCTECGDTVSVEAEVTSATTAATCTSAGYTLYTATAEVNGSTVTSVQLVAGEVATGHSYEAVVTDPTCTEQGYTTYTCSVCGDSYVDDYTEATGHTAGDAVVENEVAATCTEDGSYDSVVYCTVCGEELSRETTTVAATGHTAGEAVTENEVEATCTEDGSYDSVVYCAVCGAEISRTTTTTEATGHDYDADDVVWTWSDDYSMAIATATCKNDSSHVVVAVALASNTSGNTITSTTTAATCTTAGSTVYTATVTIDGAEYTNEKTAAIAATGHSYEAVVTDPTCTEQGYTTYTCSVCGDSYVDDYTDATGHTAGDAVVENEVAATCETDGSYDTVVYCTVCGAEISRETVTVAATGHDYDYANGTWAWSSDYATATYTVVCANDEDHTSALEAEVTSETTAASCTEDGSTAYTATVTAGGETYTDVKTVAGDAATGHSYDYSDLTWTWSGDCTSAAVSYSCTTCGDTVSVAAEISIVNVEATCTADAYALYTATAEVNGESVTSTQTVTDEGSATGHTEGEAVVENEVEATCEADGSYDTVVYCSVCGAEISRTTTTVEATGHDYDYANGTWEWADDYSATYTVTCTIDESHTLTLEAEVTSETIGNVTTYTATVTADDATYTDGATAYADEDDVVELSAADIDDQYFNGQYIEPGITITVSDGTELVEGTDYEIAYSDNLHPGTATAVVTGIGNYVGSSLTTTFEIVVPDADYSDVVDDAWYELGVNYVTALGVMTGYSDSDEFGVGDSLNRAQLAVIMWRIACPDEAAEYAVSDYSSYVSTTAESTCSGIADGKYYTAAADWCVANGVIEGKQKSDGSRYFDASGTVTFEQFCKVIASYIDADGAKSLSSSSVATTLDGFTDGDEVSSWAENYVAWCVQAGIVSGYSNSNLTYTLAPDEDVDRERVATVIMNCCESDIILLPLGQ